MFGLPGEGVSRITEFVENWVELDSQSVRFILYSPDIIVEIGHCLFDWVDTFCYFASCEVLCLTTFDSWFWSVFLFFLVLTLFKSRICSVFDRRYHGEKTLSSTVVCCRNRTCFIVRGSIGLFLIFKIDFLRGDSLPRCLCHPVRFICSIFSEISSLWKFVFNINIYFSFGVWAALVRFVDGIFKVKLLLSL